MGIIALWFGKWYHDPPSLQNTPPFLLRHFIPLWSWSYIVFIESQLVHALVNFTPPLRFNSPFTLFYSHVKVTYSCPTRDPSIYKHTSPAGHKVCPTFLTSQLPLRVVSMETLLTWQLFVHKFAHYSLTLTQVARTCEECTLIAKTKPHGQKHVRGKHFASTR